METTDPGVNRTLARMVLHVGHRHVSSRTGVATIMATYATLLICRRSARANALVRLDSR